MTPSEYREQIRTAVREEFMDETPADRVVRNSATCTSYAPGHCTHWIQALRTANKSEVAAQSWHGQVLAVRGTAILVERDDDGAHVLLRNHDAERLAKKVHGPVVINEQYAILRAGGDTVSVHPHTDVPLGPCPSDAFPRDATADQLVARLGADGGFSVPLHRGGAGR